MTLRLLCALQRNVPKNIKLKFACALADLASSDEGIEVPSVGDRPGRRITKKALAEVVEPRYEELFRLVQAELRRSGFADLVASGIVLTGGAANVANCLDLAEMSF